MAPETVVPNFTVPQQTILNEKQVTKFPTSRCTRVLAMFGGAGYLTPSSSSEIHSKSSLVPSKSSLTVVSLGSLEVFAEPFWVTGK
jgi:hypothetical protein